MTTSPRRLPPVGARPRRLPAPMGLLLIALITLGTGSFANGFGATAEETNLSGTGDAPPLPGNLDPLPGTLDPLPGLLGGPPTPVDVAEFALARLEAAMSDWRGGDWAGGALRADSALALLPALADWRPLLRAELLAPTGDTAAVRRALAELDPATEMGTRWGWRFLAESHEGAGDLEEAAQIARSAAARDPDPSRKAEQFLFAGRMTLAATDTLAAREDLWAAVRLGDVHAGARSAARLLHPIADPVTAEDEVILGLVLAAGAAWEPARQRLAPNVEAPALTTETRTELRLALGRSLHELRRFTDAEEVLSRVIATGGDGRSMRTALLWSGRSALGRGAPAVAEERFRALAAVAPGSLEAEEGLHELLQRELRTGFGPRSRSLLEALVTSGVRTASAETTVVQLGTTLYLSGSLVEAASLFERYLEGSGRSAGRQQAAYWSALANDRLGNRGLAMERLGLAHAEDPFSVYGGFAGHRSGMPLLDPFLPAGPTPAFGLEHELANAVVRLHVHRIVPTPGSLTWELGRLTEHFASRAAIYDFAEALIDGSFALQAIVLGRDLHRMEGAWNLRLLRIVHPLPHPEALIRESMARDLDPFFVAGLIRQESAWDRRIVSSAGATGLMQLMPATAREVAGNLGIALTSESLTDPDTNLRLGTAYLRNMLNRFGGRAEEALAAYNAGPARMNQWRQEATYRDRDVFMEHIPFQETRNYVKIVQQYARIYTALYGCDLEPCLGLTYPEIVARSTLASGTPTVGPGL